MERTDVQRMADSVLRDYAVPMKVLAISPAEAGWTVAFAGSFPGSPSIEVRLGCGLASAYHVRESIKRGLAVAD
jgi:hypothetical protein